MGDETVQRQREQPRAEGAIDADNALLVRHRHPFVGREAADHIANMGKVTATALGKRRRFGDAHLFLLMEQAPGDVGQRQVEIGQFLVAQRAGQRLHMFDPERGRVTAEYLLWLD